MIPAQLTDREDDPIHLPEGHSVHLPVLFLDLFVVVRVVLVVALVEHSQHRLAVTVSGGYWMPTLRKRIPCEQIL